LSVFSSKQFEIKFKVKMMQNIVGIDIGGSHITMAQVDPEKRKSFLQRM
jgi:Tfp pilus assembly PilM family ATPase